MALKSSKYPTLSWCSGFIYCTDESTCIQLVKDDLNSRQPETAWESGLSQLHEWGIEYVRGLCSVGACMFPIAETLKAQSENLQTSTLLFQRDRDYEPA